MTFPGSWDWRVAITTDNTKVDSSESNFPYYYDLSNIDSSNFWSNVQSDGGDLRVTSDEAGTTQLPLEVVAINTSSETGEIHFKDSTDSSTNKTYYLWWKASGSSESQPAVGASFGRNAVWSAYVVVHHLQDTTGAVVDSTGNYDAVNNGCTRGVAAKLSSGFSFDGSNDKVEINDDVIDVGLDSASAMSMSVWVKADVNPADDTIAYVRTNGNNEGASIYITTGNRLRIAGRSRASDSFQNVVGTTPITSTTDWYYFGGVWNFGAGQLVAYVNGSQDAVGSASFGSSTLDYTSMYFELGNLAGGRYWNGLMDEFRVRLGITSAGWFGTEHNMQDDNSSFWTTGTPVDVGGPGVVASRPLSFGGGL